MTPYEPPVADTDDVTVSVADPEAPGAIDKEAGDGVPVQPEGTVLLRSKMDAVQAVLSLFVTDTVNGTPVPAATGALCNGERLTVGLAAVQTRLETT